MSILVRHPHHASNRVAWNEAAEAYEAERDEWIAYLRNGGQNFCPAERPFIDTLAGGWCQRAIHLQCAGGTDTLSLWNAGAGEVVGVDISERMLAVAQAKSIALDAPATWRHADVLDPGDDLYGTADLVYTGRGALCWLMDLDAWAGVVARLLKPGGRLYVFDGHPIIELLDENKDHLALHPQYGNYFNTAPIPNQGWSESYVGHIVNRGREEAEHPVKWERQMRLGDVVTAVARAGLRVDELGEHPDRFWAAMPLLPERDACGLPFTFHVLATRPA